MIKINQKTVKGFCAAKVDSQVAEVCSASADGGSNKDTMEPQTESRLLTSDHQNLDWNLVINESFRNLLLERV